MSIELINRNILYLFIGSFIVVQIYFSLRIHQAKERARSGGASDNDQRMSHKVTFRYALFLIVFYLFIIIWSIYNTWAGIYSVFLGIAIIVGGLMLIRQPVTLARDSLPISTNYSIDLPLQPRLTNDVTPELITEILSQESVIHAIKNDLMKTCQIGYKEIWRLGLLTPDLDKYNLSLNQLPRKERMSKSLYFNNQIPIKRAAVLHSSTYFNFQFNNILIIHGINEPMIRRYPGWSYGLSTRIVRGNFKNIRDIEINPHSASSKNRSRFLPKFLKEDGFPLKEVYSDGDPLTTERGGTIVINQGKIKIIYPKYFMQRRLIDDAGNLVYLGLDETRDHNSSSFAVSMEPSVSKNLFKCVAYNEYIPIVRYRSFPYASDFMLPILDTPMSDSGWADLFIDTRGKAKLFIAKEKTLDEWCEMMERLRQLFFVELAKKDYHLLGLTKDKSHLYQYFSQKQAILEDYFIIRDWTLI